MSPAAVVINTLRVKSAVTDSFYQDSAKEGTQKTWDLMLSNKMANFGPAFANSIDLDQLVSSKPYWSGSALFVIQYMWICINNLNQVIWLADN